MSVEELAGLLSCTFEGDGKTEIRGVSSLERAGEGDLVFPAHPKYRTLLEESGASAAIIPTGEKFNRIPVLRSENPQLAFIKAVEVFYSPYRLQPGIHPSAIVSPSVKTGKEVAVGAFAYIGDGVSIGAKTVIFPFVSIYPGVKIGKECVIHSHVSIREDIQIGNRVFIHNGASIGSDGFGYVQDKDGSYIKIPQTGTVIIEDDVEVGANSAIDRASLGETIIKKGTKIDHLVQIAHNVEVGPNSILAVQVGISGSVKIGKNVIVEGQVGVADHLHIGDQAIMAAKTGVTKDIPPGSFVAGFPHQNIREWRKTKALLSRLHDLIKDIRGLKKKVEELEKRIK